MPTWLTDFAAELRHAVRTLLSRPLVPAVVVLTLALGIGANTAIFSVMNAVVLRYLPVRDPQQVVLIRTSGFPEGANQTGDSATSFPLAVREQLAGATDVVSDLIAYVPLSIGKSTVRHGANAEEAVAGMVSGNFFTALGVGAAAGRLLEPADEAGHTATAVLSHAYWSRRFAADPAIVGQTLFLEGVPLTILGVAAPGFAGLEADPADLWIPLQVRPELAPWGSPVPKSMYERPNWWFLHLTARLRPGVSEAQALAQLTPYFERGAYQSIGRAPRDKERKPRLSLASARGVPGLRQAYLEPLRILLAMVALVLLIACGNVALLLAARNAAREREFSIRLAIGGAQRHLLRQLLAESLLLVGAGATAAWFLGRTATGVLARWADLRLDLAPDANVLLFLFALAFGVALLFGLAPLRTLRQTSPALALKTSTATGNLSPGHRRGRRLIIGLQVALCLVLVVAAGLLVRTISNLQGANLGLRPDGLLVFGISPPRESGGREGQIRFHSRLLTHLRELPGLTAATMMENRIGSGWSNNTSAYLNGRQPAPDSVMRWNSVGPDYFRTLGISLLQGREIRDSDTESSPPVVVVNATFAARFLPGQSPLGQMLSQGDGPQSIRYQIVGVAQDSRYTGVREQGMPMAYFPYNQQPYAPGTMHYELRAAGDPAALLPAVQRAVHQFHPGVAVLEPQTQAAQFAASYTQESLFARLAACFGALAVILVATGVYGTLSYQVSRRTSEIGIRMALGAPRGRVIWLILQECLWVSGVGFALGLPMAAVASRLLRSLLYGVAPEDPMSFALALGGVCAVSLLAGLVPALRASATDPIIALRTD